MPVLFELMRHNTVIINALHLYFSNGRHWKSKIVKGLLSAGYIPMNILSLYQPLKS
jgi:hypothetical protein